MQKEDACIGLIGGLFGHKFEARFDEAVDNNKAQPNNWAVTQIPEEVLSDAINYNNENLSDIIEAMGGGTSKTTYVHDVCVRCGKIVKREQA